MYLINRLKLILRLITEIESIYIKYIGNVRGYISNLSFTNSLGLGGRLVIHFRWLIWITVIPSLQAYWERYDLVAPYYVTWVYCLPRASFPVLFLFVLSPGCCPSRAVAPGVGYRAGGCFGTITSR